MKPYLKQSFKKVKLLVAFLTIAFTINANAQELFTLKGKVVDGKNPVANASIVVKGTSNGTTSGPDGTFSFNLKKGTYTLQVSLIGTPKEVKVNLTEDVYITVDLSDSYENLEEVLVAAVRVKEGAPVTFSNVTKEEMKNRNLGQDIPILLNYLPSVVTTSDAGAGVGYTGIRVRGSDATRVNVTINGIPYNDPESQGTYWVNLPDFASSTESLQLQRGVGTSTNGSGAFGASLNLLTDAVSKEAYGEISASVGSYNTQKYTTKFSTGLINDHIEISGRLSKIDSDGYIDRAWSDLKSYFLQAAYVDDNTLIKAITFGGEEKTYQAWYGTPLARINNDEEGVEDFINDNWLNESEAENLRSSDRRYNYYTYDNETDNYNQNHYQIHWNETISEKWSTNIAFNYTKGAGYYEQFKDEEDFEDYDLDPIVIGSETIDETDLIRRRWLDNDYYVFNANATYKNNNYDIIFGGSYSYYTGDHYGEIIWAEYASNSEIRDRYYESNTKKTDSNIFAKLNYKFNNQWALFVDVQGRFTSFESNGLTSDRVPLNVDENYAFFNPKTGLTYQINEANSLYFSYARANREPNRNDYENGISNHESLNDFELGWRINKETFKINTNLYYMQYKDQLVLTGAIDDTGAPIRATSEKSYRLGLEIDASIKISNKFNIQPNIAISSNKNIDFPAYINGEELVLESTNIAFSPNFVAGSNLVYQPIPKIQLSLLSKFVGEQYMGNIDSENSKLDSYFVNDFNASFEITPNKIAESIRFNLLVNNIFNVKYISNGYYGTYEYDYNGQTYYGDYAGYYPQATINFLVGATVRF